MVAAMATDYNFVGEPDESLKCSICLEVARDPKQEEECGKLFCSGCIEEWEWEEGSCPTCRTREPRYFKDKKSLREIRALHVRCGNVERGCDWEGTVVALEDHVNMCDFTEIECPDGCGADMEVDGLLLRKNLGEHLSSRCPERDYQCQGCYAVSSYQYITEVHELECEEKIINCLNERCRLCLERGKMEEHVQRSCDYTEVYCKYADIGCDKKVIRKELEEHEKNMEHHFPIALGKISELNNVIIQRLPLTVTDKNRQITFKLEHFSEKKKGKLVHEFEPFFTSPAGYKMCFYVYPNGTNCGKGTHISPYTKLLHGPYDERLEWPFRGTVIVELLNQLSDDSHHKSTIRYDEGNTRAQAGSGGWGLFKFISHDDLTCAGQPFQKNDSLFFRLTIRQDNYKPWLVATY